MKKALNLLALVAVAGFLGLAAHVANARITGTQPTDADIACWGPEGAEACVDASGNVIPTTDNDTTLGTASLRWATVNALDLDAGDDLKVSGDLFKTMASTVTVASDATISVAGACGGVLRLAATANVTTNTTNTFTAPSASLQGCIVYLYNTGGGIITLDTNSNFAGPANVALATEDSAIIAHVSSKWVLLATSDNQ